MRSSDYDELSDVAVEVLAALARNGTPRSVTQMEDFTNRSEASVMAGLLILTGRGLAVGNSGSRPLYQCTDRGRALSWLQANHPELVAP